jgi:hypothetical protein
VANLVQAEANAILNVSSGQAAYTAPTTPIKVRLMTANGTATSAGTEVTNGGGSTYAPQTITFSAASAGSITNSGALNFTNMPGATTVVGVEEWDSLGTPVRRWFGALTASKATNLGDTFTINASSYTKTLS